MGSSLDTYCGSVFWNSSYVNREDPDLPLCFEQTVLVWIPIGFLWICSPFHLKPLCDNTQVKRKDFSKLFLAKQLVAALLFLTAIAGLIVTLADDFGPSTDPPLSEKSPAVYYVNPILFAVSWILVILCQAGVRRTEGAVDSATLFLFWLLIFMCEIFPFQTLIREALRLGEVRDVPRFSLFYISFGLEVIALILSAFADIPSEDKEYIRRKNPKAGAPFLDRITFNWIHRMIVLGYKRPLVQEDMWDVDEEDNSAHINEKFEYNMRIEVAAARVRYQNRMEKRREKEIDEEEAFHTDLCNGLGKGVSQDVLMMVEKGKKDEQRKKREDTVEEEDFPNSWLVKTIAKTYKLNLIETAIFKIMQDMLAFVSPQLLRLLVTFTEDQSIFTWYGYVYATLLFVGTGLQTLFEQQYYQRCFMLGAQVRASLMAALYKKGLLMSNEARKGSTVGETVNLMSADAQRFNDVTNWIHLLWACPLQICVAIIFLWQELGPSVLAGVAIIVLMVPINILLANQGKKVQVKNMFFKDKRLKIMNEILNGIKVLKLYAWEPSFQSQVEEIRGKELTVMRKFALISSAANCAFLSTLPMATLATFAVFVFSQSQDTFTSETAFTSLALFNILILPMSLLPMLFASLVQTAVSKKRLEKFLAGDDLQSDIVHHDHRFDSAVSVCDGSFAWDAEDEPLLKNVDLDVKPGRLVAVVGAVGSGKSSLISALLGEMYKTKGFVNIQGSLAFVPQQAWIQNVTLKDNILFGSPDEEKKFQEVIRACALIPDLELLPGGVHTEIGERGINLSGGQKQRVSLARAAYSQADIYLLDDPLSAVDSHVGKHLFDEVIGPNGILKNKTRILVTHGVSFLPFVDEIVVLVNGVVSEVGSYNSLRASKGAFSEFLELYANEQNNQPPPEPDCYKETLEVELIPEGEDIQPDCPLEDTVSTSVKNDNSLRRRERRSSVRMRKNSTLKKPESDGERAGQKLIEKEAMETGQVKFSVYIQYMRAMGWGYTASIFLTYLLQNISFITQNLWLSDWTNDAVLYDNMTYPLYTKDTRVGVYGILAVAQALFVFIAALLMAFSSIDASRILHSDLLNSILRAPMMFFDTTPIGRVVNRFAKDVFALDEAIPLSFRSLAQSMVSVLGTMVIICVATPYFAICIIPLALAYYFIQRVYIQTSRQLRRLESVSRSPIYSHFSETVSGLSVIRAYGHQDRFLEQNEMGIDENLKNVYPWIVSNRWLATRLEFLGNLVVFLAALLAVLSRDTLYGGLVGLSVANALNVTLTLNNLVRLTADLETNIVAVERVIDYTKVEREAEWINENRPPEKWPRAGRLQFDNFKVRYRPGLDLVLHGISCDIGSSEKIGIVGRTGAGKSSLTNCLFRIIEAADGRIILDDIDISTIGLHDLRNNLTIIPQDPVLFYGTLRMNLDPFDRYSDEEIWRVLELSHLKEFVSGLPEQLQHEVAEGGENLSVGQRQLVCLARALLRKSRILILDEATAAVDLGTDDLIQKTIREEFSHCTVLTIAHRLHSIMDYSRVMVLDAGKIVEFDSPSNLLENEGIFYGMAKDAGLTQEKLTSL